MINALKDYCDFYYCLTTKIQWPIGDVPVPANLHFVTHYEKGKYDIAILHVDQQVISRQDIKARIYNEFNSFIQDIPKVVINHGSPVYPEGFLNSMTPDFMQNGCILLMKDLVAKNTMVVNSHTAASKKEWGFGVPIVHGIEPDNWYDLAKEPRVFTAISNRGLDTYYNRSCLDEVKKLLFDNHGYTLWHAKDNVSTQSSKEFYKTFLGSSLLYLDPSFRTPMNRARTEAMLSGCCVIQVEGAHDLDRWAKANENIVIVPNEPLVIVQTIVDFLENNYQKAIEIGQQGKKIATKMFSPQQYRERWLKLLKKITSNT